MNSDFITACEAFSLGQPAAALKMFSEDIAWNIVGDRSVVGLKEVKAMCKEAAQAGEPNFRNIRTITTESYIIVEGADLNSEVYYCDIYAFEGESITEVTSYGLSGEQ
ncbi:MAG: hypothetical protein ACI81V_001322 [Lentimonas sp.]|jgi:hypothetical protein